MQNEFIRLSLIRDESSALVKTARDKLHLLEQIDYVGTNVNIYLSSNLT